MKPLERSPEYYFYLGDTYKKQGMLDQAIEYFEKSLMLNPRSPHTLHNLGNALREKGDFDRAVRSYEAALAIDDNYVPAFNGIGITFLETAEFEKAIAWFKKLTDMFPTWAEGYNNLGVAYRETGRFEDAKASFKDAIRLDPASEIARQNLSALYLLLGDFRRGWQEYRWFWSLKGPYHRFERPLWEGEDIAGKTLFLHAGSGFGDALQFIRYAPFIAARGTKVIIGCRREIASLLRGADGVSRVVTEGESLPPFDVQSSLFRLPIIFDASRDNIPANVPYLSLSPDIVAQWKAAMPAASGKMRIGLVWRGGHHFGMYRQRALPPYLLDEWSDVPNAEFYSLQMRDARAKGEDMPLTLQLIDPTPGIRDFLDTAAIIENLDLVISVDTAVAHLAGALGKPVWTLLPFVPDWRWLLEREDSPWYPTMRLFRQASRGDWSTVIANVHNDLEAITSQRTSNNER